MNEKCLSVAVLINYKILVIDIFYFICFYVQTMFKLFS